MCYEVFMFNAHVAFPIFQGDASVVLDISDIKALTPCARAIVLVPYCVFMCSCHAGGEELGQQGYQGHTTA
jgi:hypothetical protein